MAVTRTCAHCSAEYRTFAMNSKYCGEPCYRRAYRKRHPERVARYERNQNLRERGMGGIDHYERVLAQQRGVCAICGLPPDPAKHYGVLVADHDHETGLFRGLLCDDCNVGIGRLRDDPERVRRAWEYLTGDPTGL